MTDSENKIVPIENTAGGLPVADSFHTRPVVLISAAHAIHDSYTGFLPPLLPVIIDNLALSKSQASLLAIAINVPSLLQPFIGYLADRTSLRLLIILTPAVTAVLMSSIGNLPNYLFTFFLLILVGISSAGFHAVGPVVAGYLSGNNLGRGMGIMMVGGELGRTVGPLAVVTFLSFYSIEQLPYLMIFGLLASLVLYFLLKDLPDRPVGTQPQSLPLRGVVHMMGPVLLPVAVYMVLRSFAFKSMTIFLPLFLTEEGYSLLLAGASLTIFEAAGIAGALAGGTLSDVFGRRTVLFLSMAITPLLVLLFLVSGQWVRLILLVLTGFSVLSVTPVLMAIVQENFPENRSLANGSFMAVSFLSNALALAVVGGSGDLFGLRTTIFVSAIVMLLGTAVVFLIPKNHAGK